MSKRYTVGDFSITITVVGITIVGICGKLLGLDWSWKIILMPLYFYIGIWVTLVLAFFIIGYFWRK